MADNETVLVLRAEIDLSRAEKSLRGKAKLLRYGLEFKSCELMVDFQKFSWRKELLRTEVRWL